MNNESLIQIRNSVDIVEVISKYVPLSAHGKNYFGVCPFHDDHSPSMSVSKEKQIFTCFSCGATGNVFTFLQDYENISFSEAVNMCAEIAGIKNDFYVKKENHKFQSLYDIYNLAQKLYQNNFNSIKGKEAKEYLYSRKLSDEIIKEFQIGLSLNENDMLVKLLKDKFSVKDLINSGLINEDGSKLYDVYRNRIMFPLYDLSGKIIGYNGRIYGNNNSNSKYVNSKETPIFKKRNLLYNYHRAKEYARKSKSIIIVEGPMDVIRCYEAGVKNVVAALGTAFGSEQAMLLRKLSNNIILCFDGDEAGLKATKSAILELGKLNISPKIVRLPNNLDPDEFILKNGKDSFNNYINNPMNIMEFNEKLLKQNIDLNNTEDLAKYANSMIKEIEKIDDDILREISINKLAKETNLDKTFIEERINREEKTKDNIIENKSNNQKKEVKKRLTKYEKSEQRLLYYMLKDTSVIRMYEKKSARISNDSYRKLAFQICLYYKEHNNINIADLMIELHNDEESIKVIGEIENLNLKDNYLVEEIEDYLNNIREYNEKNNYKMKKKDLVEEKDLNRKIELAKQAIAHKIRSDESDRRD